MSALPYQPVPTIAQRKAFAADFAKRHPGSQYRDNQDDAIAEMQAARLRYERDEPANCAVPTPGEDGEPQVMAWVGSTPSLIIIALACAAWVIYYWGTP